MSQYKVLSCIFTLLHFSQAFSHSHNFCIYGEQISVAENKIFLKQGSEWNLIGGISDKGAYVYDPQKESISPMCSCSRLEIEWDYAHGKIRITGEKERDSNRDNQDDSNNNEKPTASDHNHDRDSERDKEWNG